jgi:hypothetical protein
MRSSRKRFLTIVLAAASLVGVSIASGLAVLPASAAAATLSFTPAPGVEPACAGANCVAGQPLSTQPVVSLSGNSIGASVTLSISPGTGTPGATLTCAQAANTVTVATVGGTATFTGCSINYSGSGYTLTATDTTDGGVTAVSTAFTVGAAHLAFSTQPPLTAVAGTTLAVGVSLENASNAVVTSATDLVSLTIFSGTNPSATLTCAPTAMIAGVATFGSPCFINLVGTYTLAAADNTDTSITATTSNSFSITPAAKAALAFTVSPALNSTVSVNSDFPISVAVEDTFGNVITTGAGSTDVIQLDMSVDPPGTATLTCPTYPLNEATAVAGIATYASGCQINKAGTGFVLTPADETTPLTQPLSPAFNVGAGTHLVFTTEPGSGAPGGQLSPQPVVSVENMSGVVVSSSDQITLAISFNAGGGTLGCTSLTVPASAGVATFSGCEINDVGTGYTLLATDATNPAVASATSSAFNVQTGNHLAFSTEPGNGTPGGLLSPQPVISVENASGGLVSSADEITLAISNNPGSGTLSCTATTVVASAGVATFSGCSISAAGTGYTLIATDITNGAVTAVTSSTFSVVSGTHLAFTTEPGNGSVRSALSPQPVVSVENASNTVISSTDQITLAISFNPGSGILTCTTNTVTASAGVATFSGCSISAAGTGYTLIATDITTSSVVSATSSGFNVGTTPLPEQIYGIDAIGTSIAISEAEFPATGSAGAVVLARDDFFSDALAGGPLAAAVDGPMLITPGAGISSTLDPRVQAEIQRVLPTGRTVYILGGDLALSPTIDTTLVSLGYNVVREAGADEYATAVDIAQQLGNPSVIFEATGLNFYDALSAVPAAIKQHAAILLTNGTAQASETAAYLARFPGDTRYAIGGPLAAYGADPGATPIYGQDLFNTSEAVAAHFFPTTSIFGAATAAEFPDALGGGVFMATGTRSGPLLLVNQNTPLPPEITPYLAGLALGTQGYVFGGPLAVSSSVVTALQAAVG